MMTERERRFCKRLQALEKLSDKLHTRYLAAVDADDEAAMAEIEPELLKATLQKWTLQALLFRESATRRLREQDEELGFRTPKLDD